MKECFKCGVERPLSDYYKHAQMADGHLNKCKECTKNDVRERRFDPKFREKVLEYDRSRGARQDPDYCKEYRERFPLKYKAHSALNNAVRSGKISKPEACEECGSTFALNGHHDDYSKPLDVRWLCSACHRQWHATNGEALNAI